MHDLPVWFLVASLLFPRICLAVAWFKHVPSVTALSGILPVGLAVVFPRILVILLIYGSLGWSWWLVLHSLFLGMTYWGTGKKSVRK